MYGSNVGTLNVNKVSGVLSQLRWTTTGGKGYEWNHAQVNLLSSSSNPTQFSVCVHSLSKLVLHDIMYLSRLKSKEFGRKLIVDLYLLMILYLSMVHVKQRLINVISIRMKRFAVGKHRSCP
jgi:hypothetical protein